MGQLARCRAADPTLPSAYVVAVLDAVWTCVAPDRKNTAKFLVEEGMDVLLDLLEVGDHSTCLQAGIQGWIGRVMVPLFSGARVPPGRQQTCLWASCSSPIQHKSCSTGVCTMHRACTKCLPGSLETDNSTLVARPDILSVLQLHAALGFLRWVTGATERWHCPSWRTCSPTLAHIHSSTSGAPPAIKPAQPTCFSGCGRCAC